MADDETSGSEESKSSGHRLVDESDHAYRVLSPEGDLITIAKVGLDDDHMDRISKLPRVNSDGSLNKSTDDAPYGTADNVYGTEQVIPPAPPADTSTIQLPPDPARPVPVSQPEPAPVPAAPAPAVPAAGPPTEAQVSGAMSPQMAAEKAFQQQGQGIQAAANAKSKEADQQAQAYALYQKQMADWAALHQQRMAAIDAEQNKLAQDIQTQKIDPNRLWHETSTGNKVLASIGLVLSGIGSGLTGQPNAALQVMEHAMDRDLEAQKANLNNKHSLYSMNLQKYRSIEMADMATRLQMNTALQSQLGIAAARSGSAQAQAAAQMALGQLGVQSATLKNEMAKQQVTAQMNGVGGGEGGFPVGQVPAFLANDKDYQEHLVRVNGREYRYAGKPEAAQDWRNVETTAGSVVDLVHQLDKLGPGALIPGSKENEMAEGLRAQIATEIPKLKSMQIGAKRVNDTEAERALEMVSNPTKFRQAANGGLRNQIFFKQLSDELEAGRKSNLQGYRGIAHFDSFRPMGGAK